MQNDFRKINKLFNNFPLSDPLQLYNAFPWFMRRLPGPHQTLKEIYGEVNKFIAEEIEEHKKNLDPSDPRDYIDCFLSEIEKVSQSSSDDDASWDPWLIAHRQNYFLSNFSPIIFRLRESQTAAFMKRT